jgi:hypothetical protein
VPVWTTALYTSRREWPGLVSRIADVIQAVTWSTPSSRCDETLQSPPRPSEQVEHTNMLVVHIFEE